MESTKVIQYILEAVAEDTAQRLKDNLSRHLGPDSGLSNSLEIQYNAADDSVALLAAHYWQYAEKGRGPGGVPRNFEAIIARWAAKRGIDVSPTAVKWKTIKEGSALWRRGGRDFGLDEAAQAAIDNLNIDNIDII